MVPAGKVFREGPTSTPLNQTMSKAPPSRTRTWAACAGVLAGRDFGGVVGAEVSRPGARAMADIAGDVMGRNLSLATRAQRNDVADGV
jgi:outer membrane lipoprotein SlyB